MKSKLNILIILFFTAISCSAIVVYQYQQQFLKDRILETKSNLQHIACMMKIWDDNNSNEELDLILKEKEMNLIDLWGGKIRTQKIEREAGIDYYAKSDGPDGAIATDDDIIMIETKLRPKPVNDVLINLRNKLMLKAVEKIVEGNL